MFVNEDLGKFWGTVHPEFCSRCQLERDHWPASHLENPMDVTKSLREERGVKLPRVGWAPKLTCSEASLQDQVPIYADARSFPCTEGDSSAFCVHTDRQIPTHQEKA